MITNYNDFRGSTAFLYQLTQSAQRTLSLIKGARTGELDAIYADRMHAIMYHRQHQSEF